MASPPAKCTQCGHVFYGTAFVFSGGAQPIFRNCTTNCPKCGGLAKYGDGHFSEKNGRVELLNGPSITKAMLDQLKGIYQDARDSKLTSEELISAVSGLSPEVAGKILKNRWPIAAILLLLFKIIDSFSMNVTVDLNELFDQIQETVASGNEMSMPPPLPVDTSQPIGPAPKIAAISSTIGASRQVRRQLERQAKKRRQNG